MKETGNYRVGLYVEVNVPGVDEADARNRACGLTARALDEEIQLAVRSVQPLCFHEERA